MIFISPRFYKRSSQPRVSRNTQDSEELLMPEIPTGPGGRAWHFMIFTGVAGRVQGGPKVPGPWCTHTFFQLFSETLI